MKMVFPDYNDCITNVACSVLKYFDVKPTHNTVKELDEILEKNNPKNVVVILYDGLGYNLVNRNLNEKSFLRNHMIKSLSSVAPSTTTAATTSMLSGLNPCEHGWLGWDLFVPGFNDIVTLFENERKKDRTKIKEYNVAKKYFEYENILTKIKNTGKYDSKLISPYGNGIKYFGLRDMCNKIIRECNKDGKKYIYAYFEDPDTIMHIIGTSAWATKRKFREIDKETKRLCDHLKDTVVVVVADHGHLDYETYILSKKYPDLYETIDGETWIESRLCAFKVKDEEKFKTLFNKYLGDEFVLKSKKEVIDEKLFGDGKEHELFRDSLGDYFALASSNKGIKYNKITFKMKSSHAGFSEDEMRIPLVVINK